MSTFAANCTEQTVYCEEWNACTGISILWSLCCQLISLFPLFLRRKEHAYCTLSILFLSAAMFVLLAYALLMFCARYQQIQLH
jgi:hypothetical protein